jgi:hypothetical protein
MFRLGMTRFVLAMFLTPLCLPFGLLPAPWSTEARAADRRADVASLARQILDDAGPEADRKKLITDHPEVTSDLIHALVADMPTDDSKEEYRRIPWIWRVAVAAGKRNNIDEMRPIVDIAIPQANQPLRDWQAVVLGGGIINGIGLSGAWADEQMRKIVAADPALESRWGQTLKLAATMADNKKVFKGTRYDALRILGMDSWKRRGGQLFRYLLKGADDELQQGAIGGVGDMRSPCSAQAILSGFAHYNAENRRFALKALLCDDGRTSALIDAIEAGTVKPADLGEAYTAKLTGHHNPALRARASKLLAGTGRQ